MAILQGGGGATTKGKWKCSGGGTWCSWCSECFLRVSPLSPTSPFIAEDGCKGAFESLPPLIYFTHGSNHTCPTRVHACPSRVWISSRESARQASIFRNLRFFHMGIVSRWIISLPPLSSSIWATCKDSHCSHHWLALQLMAVCAHEKTLGCNACCWYIIFIYLLLFLEGVHPAHLFDIPYQILRLM